MPTGPAPELSPGLAAAVEYQKRQNARLVAAANRITAPARQAAIATHGQMQSEMSRIMAVPVVRAWNARPRPEQYTRDTAPLWLYWPDDWEPQNWTTPNEPRPPHELEWQQPAPTDAGHLADVLVNAPAAPPAAGYCMRAA